MISHDTLSRLKYWLLLTAGVMLTLSSCDDTFQPLQENDTFFFSIQGYLDASADTQWVRVGTIRPTIDEVPNPEGIQVTLKDLESGETVVMSDSVFTIRNVLNYWTTYEIKHEQTYEITAKYADGTTSRVTMTTPAELPSVHIIGQGGVGVASGVRIFIDDTVEHIADVQSVWYVILNPETENRRSIYSFPLRNSLTHSRSYFGSYTALVNWERELAQIEQSVGVGTAIAIVNRQIFVAVGGPEWDENISSIADFEYFLAGNASNVENGLGYVVGVSTKWFRQSICETPDGSNYAPCEPEERYWYKE
tara:strand:+ start:328 stop:1248 length:921 start_codon:yes stop_codon:yes gene_type:complete